VHVTTTCRRIDLALALHSGARILLAARVHVVNASISGINRETLAAIMNALKAAVSGVLARALVE
jgi:hypothetical protein